MRVMESFLCGKENNPWTCEDGIFISDRLIAVIDGVTAKGNRLWNGQRSGNYAKELFIDYLQNGAEEQTAVRLLENLDAILKERIAACHEKLPTEEYPRASVIIYNDIYKEIWSYGDCQCRINDMVHTHVKKIDELNSDLRAFILEYHLLNGAKPEELAESDPGRAGIQENLMRQFEFENKAGEFGYPVLNGRGIEESMIKRYKLCEGDEVILASDGYPELGKDLSASEEILSRILQEDPMCFQKFRCTKGVKKGNISFDDRAFCRFIV